MIVAGGVISDVLPTFARKPLFSHRGAMVSLLAIGVLGPLAWMQNMYTAPISLGFEVFAMFFALLLTVPIGLLVFNWLATIWGGTLHIRAAPLFALGAISALTIGLAGELAWSVIPVGWQIDNTTAAQGDTMAVLVGGAVLAGFAALHYWFPKLCGRMMGEGARQARAGNDPRRALRLRPDGLLRRRQGLSRSTSTSTSLGTASTATTWSRRSRSSWSPSGSRSSSPTPPTATTGRRAGHDPWGGATLEWFALSPPQEHNFDAVPDVRSAEPLHDIRRAIRDRTEAWRPPPPPEDVAASDREAEPAADAAEGPR